MRPNICFLFATSIFFIDVFNFATTYYNISCISLPLAVVHTKFKLIKEIVNDDEDLWNEWLFMNVAYFLSPLLKYVLTKVVTAVLKRL